MLREAEYVRERCLGRAVQALGCVEFPEMLAEFVRQLVRFDNLIILAYFREHNPVALYRECVDPVVYSLMDSDYLCAAYMLDPFYDAHLNKIDNGCYRIFDIAPDQFKRTSYFNIYYNKTTLIDEIAAFSNISDDVTITACFGKDCSSRALFSKRDQALLKKYEAVICSLIEVHWRGFLPDYIAKPDDVQPPLIDRLRKALEQERGVRLSPRQAEVALYILQGHSSVSISLNLGISHETVKVFRKQLYAKCNISSQAELFAMMLPLFSRITNGNELVSNLPISNAEALPRHL